MCFPEIDSTQKTYGPWDQDDDLVPEAIVPPFADVQDFRRYCRTKSTNDMFELPRPGYLYMDTEFIDRLGHDRRPDDDICKIIAEYNRDMKENLQLKKTLCWTAKFLCSFYTIEVYDLNKDSRVRRFHLATWIHGSEMLVGRFKDVTSTSTLPPPFVLDDDLGCRKISHSINFAFDPFDPTFPTEQLIFG